MIALGEVSGGPETQGSPLDRSIREVGIAIQRCRQNYEPGFLINVVFHTGWSICPVDFQGLRTGRLDRKNSRFLVQVACDKDDHQEGNEFVFDRIQESLELAIPYLRGKGIDLDIYRYEELMSEVRKALSGPNLDG